MGFSRQEYCSGFPYPPPGDPPDPGIEPFSCIARDSLPLSPQGNPTLDTIPHLILVIRAFVALRILFLCLELLSLHSGFLFVWFISVPPWNSSQLFRQDLVLPENSLYPHLCRQLCYTFFLIHVIIVFYFFFFFVFSYWPVPSLKECVLLLFQSPAAKLIIGIEQVLTNVRNMNGFSWSMDVNEPHEWFYTKI